VCACKKYIKIQCICVVFFQNFQNSEGLHVPQDVFSKKIKVKFPSFFFHLPLEYKQAALHKYPKPAQDGGFEWHHSLDI